MARAAQGERRVARAVCAVALVVLSGASARANGRYPASGRVVFDPVDPSHLVVSATFGLLESRDGGKTFLWRCEGAIGVADQQDLMIAVTASGATVTTRADGVATTIDGCSYFQPPELLGQTIGDLTLYRSQPHALAAFSSDSRLDGGFDSQVVRSSDDGRTWAVLGSALPTDFLPFTIDAAPSDASRLYLSGRLGGANEFASALLRSRDGGATFGSAAIPETEQHQLAYIAGVDPLHPDRVYVRVFHPSGTAVLITDDAGATFRKVFTGTDQILGFAVSPDGSQMAIGGPGDGIWVGDADGTNLTRRSDVRPTCLGWSTDGLYACADVMVDGFSVGRSGDDAATFEPLLRFSALCGDTGCNPDSGTAAACAAAWTVVGPTLGSICGNDAGMSDAGGAADAPLDVAAPTDAEATHDLDLTAGGGGCALGRSHPAGSMGLLVLLGLAIWRRRSSDDGQGLV